MVVLIAILQVAIMYVGYGAKTLGLPSILALLFFVAPLVAGLVEFRLLESAGLRPRDSFAAALGATLVATFVGTYLAFNSFGT